VRSLEQRIRNLEGNDGLAQRRRVAMALVVVGQMLPGGAIKGGSAMALRYGRGTRFTQDLDAARIQPLARFRSDFEESLVAGWAGFTGRLVEKEEQLRSPAHWDIAFIRRFMISFGPLSSVFDFGTFAIMLWVFHSGPEQFRSGWFVESLATQTLVIFAIRTRRIPFFRSHPSLPLTLAALSVVAVGALLPATPLAHVLGFQPLPAGFFAALAAMVVAYLALIEFGKRIFYGAAARAPRTRRPYSKHRHLRRRAAYFSTAGREPTAKRSPSPRVPERSGSRTPTKTSVRRKPRPATRRPPQGSAATSPKS
jgi:hypothetical protein